MSNILIVSCVLMTVLFPANDGWEQFMVRLIFLVITPVLFIRFFLKEKIRDFGFTFGDSTQGLVWLVVFLIVTGASLIGLHRFTDVLSQVQIPLAVRSSFAIFLLYIGLAGGFFLIQEFFLRGFVLHIWKPEYQRKAILIQALVALFFPLLQANSRTVQQCSLTLFFALIGGWIAYYSRSIIYSFFFFFISAILGIAVLLVFVR